MKRFLTRVSVLLISLLLLPKTAFAQVDIAGAFASVLVKYLGFYVNLLATITGVLLGLGVMIFNWVCSENFISLSYTNAGLSLGDPHFNQFLYIGWTLTRDLTNIFFVIALVVIGLGTALRIQDYQAKKALPKLIIIALLINFTPVILGLIVDASNIVMNFFIQGGFAGGNSFVNFVARQWTTPLFNITDQNFWNPMANIAAFAGSFVLIFFNLIAFLIYLLFSFIFILRYIAIWILVILSPFAFASYILPATKNVWDMWWKTFIQWSIIGAIAAFFLYLGDNFIGTAISGKFFSGSLEGEVANARGLAPIINSILPYFISIILLFIGLFASLAFAPKGADAIINAGQRGLKASGKVLGTRAWAGAVKTAKAPFAPATRAGREAYKIHRGLGHSRRQALGAAMERGWAAVRLETGWRTKAAVKAAHGAVAKGTWSAIKDSAKAGWKAAIKAKKKKKGEKCPRCGVALPADADFCPNPDCHLPF